MDNIEIIKSYFEKFFSGPARHSEVRDLLTEDFQFRDPLMSAESADDYVSQLVKLGDEMDLYAHVREILAGGETVAALVDFEGPTGTVTYAQWFKIRNGKIAGLQVLYDPRPFLDRDSL